jgi:phage-related protein
MFKIEWYTLPNGIKPVRVFLDGLTKKMRVKALGSLDMLAKDGNALKPPYSKAVGKGLFELRIQFANDISRIFYFFCVGNKIVLTNGFIKKTQETPKRELELARKYKADYERRTKWTTSKNI